jgi:hypothetical protein
MAAEISLLSAWPKAGMAGTAVKDARTDSGRPDPGAARAWEQVAALAAEIDTQLEAKAAALDPRTAPATGEKPAGPWISNPSAPSPTRRKPTARPSGSSNPY